MYKEFYYNLETIYTFHMHFLVFGVIVITYKEGLTGSVFKNSILRKWLMEKTGSSILFRSTFMKYELASGLLKYSKCPLRGNVDLF